MALAPALDLRNFFEVISRAFDAPKTHSIPWLIELLWSKMCQKLRERVGKCEVHWPTPCDLQRTQNCCGGAEKKPEVGEQPPAVGNRATGNWERTGSFGRKQTEKSTLCAPDPREQTPPTERVRPDATSQVGPTCAGRGSCGGWGLDRWREAGRRVDRWGGRLVHVGPVLVLRLLALCRVRCLRRCTISGAESILTLFREIYVIRIGQTSGKTKPPTGTKNRSSSIKTGESQNRANEHKTTRGPISTTAAQPAAKQSLTHCCLHGLLLLPVLMPTGSRPFAGFRRR